MVLFVLSFPFKDLWLLISFIFFHSSEKNEIKFVSLTGCANESAKGTAPKLLNKLNFINLSLQYELSQLKGVRNVNFVIGNDRLH